MINSVEKLEQLRRRNTRDFALGYNPRDAKYYGGGWTVAPSFIILIAITAASGYAVWHNQYGNIAATTFLISSAIVALCIHEFGHAIVAYVGGDKSVRAKGYLTLDVLRYADLTNSIIFPMAFLVLGGIPLPGGAVYINKSALRSRLWESFVSVAGVAFSAIALIPLVYLCHNGIEGSQRFWDVVSFLIYIEIASILLNLLPIPSFDGFGVIEPWLPRLLKSGLQKISRILQFLPFLILFVPNPILTKVWEYTDRTTEVLNIQPVKLEILDPKGFLDIAEFGNIFQGIPNLIPTGFQNVVSNSVSMCSQQDVVKLAKEQVEEQVRILFGAINAFSALITQQKNRIVVSVELNEFREYRTFDYSIKKRFCEATALIKISGLIENEQTKLGLALSGIYPKLLSDGVTDTIRYSIQLTEDGTELVGLEDDSNLLRGAE